MRDVSDSGEVEPTRSVKFEGQSERENRVSSWDLNNGMDRMEGCSEYRTLKEKRSV